MYVPIMNQQQFDQALAQPKPVLVVFGERGCPFCQATKPVVRRFAAKHPEVEAVEINCDHLPELANKYRIQSLPTLILFVGGKAVKRASGQHDLTQVEKLVGRALGGSGQ